ncbi:hypothetical protein PS691_01930 [Pseudomonas fluorescens]|uniref:Uncharacterized protein n=1 Tax=Pseudomonas fluorescens TaxID=294 RepID=A0A5E7BIW4_PSEFL|nr:hypothetical protein PS691_01930 [Pseudomonas fluorescens]
MSFVPLARPTGITRRLSEKCLFKCDYCRSINAVIVLFRCFNTRFRFTVRPRRRYRGCLIIF